MLFLCNDCNGVLPKTKSSADLEVLEGEEPPAEYESSAFVVEDLCGGFAFPFKALLVVWPDVCGIFTHLC